MRVYELARELGMTSKNILAVLEEMIPLKRTASSRVPDETISWLRAATPSLLEQQPEPGASSALEPEERETFVVLAPERIRADSAPTDVTRRAGRWGRILAVWTLLGIAAGLLLAITIPYLLGYRSLTVLSGSMAPAFNAGDVVVAEQISPLEARIGDVVSFRDPENGSRLVTHRVRRMEVEEGSVTFVTKGDANTSVEQWKVTPDGTIGRVRYYVPKVGYALYWTRGRLGRIFLIVVPALLLGAYELVRIWRPEPEDPEPEEVADAVPA